MFADWAVTLPSASVVPYDLGWSFSPLCAVSLLDLSVRFFLSRPRASLLDRVPVADAKVLGTAADLKSAPPSSELKGLRGLISKCILAFVLHDVSVAGSCGNRDNPAMELLYNIDAY